MPLLDKQQPVIVIKSIITPGGNVFEARATPYEPGEIPEDFLTDEYCTQKGVTFRPIPANTPTQALTPLTEETVALQVGTLDVAGREVININIAAPEKIAAFIDGAGPKTVEKLDTLRQEQPFKSIEDLNERCPLPKVSGKTWDIYADVISF